MSSVQGDGAGSVRKVNPRTGWLTTPAGNGSGGNALLGGLATDTGIASCGVAVDHSGNLVIADQQHQMILVVARKTGMFYGQAMTIGHTYTVAGNGTPGFSGDGGPATLAQLGNPGGVAVDGAGNLLIGDGGNGRVRVVADSTGTFYGQAMTAGDIYTVAGDGTQGSSGDGGAGTSAELYDPEGSRSLPRAAC